MNRDAPIDVLVVADMIVAVYDNAGRHISRRDADRYATDLLEMLQLAGYRFVNEPAEPVRPRWRDL